MLVTIVRKNEPFEKAVRRFETECRKARIIQKFMEKTSYISPSEKKHMRRRRRQSQRPTI